MRDTVSCFQNHRYLFVRIRTFPPPIPWSVHVNETSVVLKELDYPNFWIGTSRVAYAIFPDRRVVFSGITREGTSTINAAESIIQEICRREEIDPYAHRWFDLQTNRQYGDGRFNCPHPGEFEFNELHFRPNPHPGVTQQTDERGQPYTLVSTPEAYCVERWTPVPCPPEVVAAFRECIGDPDRPPHQCKNTMDHDPNRPLRFC